MPGRRGLQDRPEVLMCGRLGRSARRFVPTRGPKAAEDLAMAPVVWIRTWSKFDHISETDILLRGSPDGWSGRGPAGATVCSAPV